MQNPKLRYAIDRAEQELPAHEQDRLARDILFEVASYSASSTTGGFVQHDPNNQPRHTLAPR